MKTELAANETQVLRALKKRLQDRYDLLEMKVFGSKARGEAAPDSDIDLFILLRKVNWQIEREIYDLCFEINLEYNVFISPVIFSEKELEDLSMKSSPFVTTIEREGIPL